MEPADFARLSQLPPDEARALLHTLVDACPAAHVVNLLQMLVLLCEWRQALAEAGWDAGC